MEPVSFLLGLLVLTGCFSVGVRVTSDAIATARAAKAGQWDLIDRDRQRRASRGERWAAAWDAVRRRRHRQAGGSGDYRPGFGAYASDVYHGFWEDQLARRQAKRAARPEFVPDPDRRPWHERFDAAVLAKVERLREAWRQRQGSATEPPKPAEPPAEPPAGPAAHEPGTWTVGDDGQRVPLAAATDPQPTEPEPAPEPAQQDPIDETSQEEPMDATDTTPAAATATEVQTNEDARRNFQAMADAAAEAADALVALETARAKMAAASQATADGMSAKAFDAGATAAANEAVDAIGLDTLGGWAEKIDAVRGAADKGLAGLDKYRDAEAQVAEERIDPTTLAATSS
jgi:hypothetical protein